MKTDLKIGQVYSPTWLHVDKPERKIVRIGYIGIGYIGVEYESSGKKQRNTISSFKAWVRKTGAVVS